MEVIPINIDPEDSSIDYVNIWNLSDSKDIHWRFNSYVKDSLRISAWGSCGTRDEYFLTIL